MSLDLARSLPDGWGLTGASAPRFDGANWFRALDGQASLTLRVTAPSFVTLRFQTHSGGSAYHLEALQSGRSLLQEDVARADYHNAYLNLRLPAGASRVELKVTCTKVGSCLPLSLYHLSAETVAVHATPPLTLLLTLGLASLLAAAFAWGLLGRPRPRRSSRPG